MVKDQRWQIYPNVVQCLTLTLVDCHRKCHLNRKLTTMQNKWPISLRGTWWCRVWTHVCQHCSLWWFLLQWHVDPISWQSTSYHYTILLINWNCTTKGLAHPLWVPAYDLQYRWIAKCSEIPPDTMNPLKLLQQHLHLLLSEPKNLCLSTCVILQIAI